MPPPSSKSLLLATAVVCALGGFLLKATEPEADRQPSLAFVPAARSATTRVAVDDGASRMRYHDRHRRHAPAVAVASGEESWRDDPQPRPAGVGDDTSAGAEPLRVAYGVIRAPVRQPVAPASAVADTPVTGRSRRGKDRKHKQPHRVRPGHPSDSPEAAEARKPPRGSAPAGSSATVPPPAPSPTTVATADPVVPNDVTFLSPDDVQFPTDGQVAIPISGRDHREGGTVSLWVQPGWARANKDDATLVQLGDQVRVAKNAHAISLETAGDENPEADDGAPVEAPITAWNPGEWHHVAATWSADAVSLYVDGELVGRGLGRGHLDLPSDTELLVGSDAVPGRRVARGLIGRVDVRDRPLGDDEVASDYRGEPAGKGGDDRAPGATHDHGNPEPPGRSRAR